MGGEIFGAAMRPVVICTRLSGSSSDHHDCPVRVLVWDSRVLAQELAAGDDFTHISKEGDRYLRTLLVQGAQYILGPFGQDSDLRRWGLKLAERGGKNAKKRAIVAVARKLAVLLHKLWVSGEVYEPLRNNHKVAAAVA
jgi:hypothetical protein